MRTVDDSRSLSKLADRAAVRAARRAAERRMIFALASDLARVPRFLVGTAAVDLTHEDFSEEVHAAIVEAITEIATAAPELAIGEAELLEEIRGRGQWWSRRACGVLLSIFAEAQGREP